MFVKLALVADVDNIFVLKVDVNTKKAMWLVSLLLPALCRLVSFAIPLQAMFLKVWIIHTLDAKLDIPLPLYKAIHFITHHSNLPIGLISIEIREAKETN